MIKLQKQLNLKLKIANDPYQLMNLAGDTEYAEALKQMRILLDEWINEFDDKVPENPKPDKFDRWNK